MSKRQRDDWKAIRDALRALDRLASLRGWSLAWELTPNLDERETEMSGDIRIEIRDGESVADAILRVAKERSGTKPSKPAKNDSPSLPTRTIGEIQAELARKAPKPSPVEKFGGDPNSGQEEQPEIYAALHVYQRDGETVEKMRYNARREREMHGPGTLVFAHAHTFGLECSSACKVRVVGE